MPTKAKLLLSSLALVALATSPGLVLAQQSFPMVCRGGGNMRAEILANGAMRVFFTPAA
jgi:hypothetical protein